MRSIFFLSETRPNQSIKSRQQDVEAVRNKPASSTTYATDEEIEVAVAALTMAELKKLGSLADFYAGALAARGAGVSGNDLVQDAITRTFAGQRRWPTSVPFARYLMAAVRSIAHAAVKKLKCEPLTDVDPADEQLGEQLTAKLIADASQQARVAAEVERVEQLFSDDERVRLIMEGLKDGMSGPEIQEWLTLSRTEYETAMKRLRRGARRKE